MKDLQLVLAEPCLEQWNDMKQTDDGRYCDRCEKTILDLTDKSDAELLRFFKNKQENVCGRLLSTQLNRKLVQPSSDLRWHWLMPLAMGAAIITPAQAQNLKPLIVNADKMAASAPVSVDSVAKTSVVRDTLNGMVVDNFTGKPLTGVKVRQKHFENVLAITDSTGRFEIGTTNKDIAAPFIFELDGYSAVETSLNDNIIVKLTTVITIRLGGVSTVALDKKPLLVVYAGKDSCTIDVSRMKEIPPEWIEKLEVLKDAKAAVAVYGSKAAYGVIIIEIKEAHAKKFDFSQKN
ncbi:hypothetical protein [Pedobacter antarcticus]|uniref:TonB-dependent receptor plug domain-containing protein n=2 Tax=Pedobacter antarcticus TaxID=34086 RepID=A0A081PI90_9SPHI|nr:hypothetical protein [Pedobacter antarcticus]KEQ30413.1 hypothetical protein N180_14820 [Pedobacter antarcticus 4BY]SDM07759.1 TonB-dependent outer membrane receptor, SusC/RagA subfamily, signature region [Pedobacter antarcticus]SFF41771.1 TonB-dependent outer membrane receptor, SusC/RagA subfamily, signature region [Pedobacter antarcticus]